MQGCTRSCLTYSIVFLNTFVVITGAATAGLGIWLYVDSKRFTDLTKLTESDRPDHSIAEKGAFVLIAGGCAAFLFGFLACAAVMLKNKCLLSTYIILTTIAYTLEVAAATLGIVFKDQWENGLISEMEKKIENDYDGKPNSTSLFTRLMDSIQEKLECCGIHNSSDYLKSKHWNQTFNDSRLMVPASCCLDRDEKLQSGCLINPPTENSNSDQGCKEEVEKLLQKYHGIIIGMAFGILTLQFLSVIISLVFLGSVASKKYNLD